MLSRVSRFGGTLPGGADGIVTGLAVPLSTVADRSAPIVATLAGDDWYVAIAAATVARVDTVDVRQDRRRVGRQATADRA